MLRKEYLPKMGLEPKQLRALLGTENGKKVTKLLQGKESIDRSLAFGLARIFDTSPEFWQLLQQIYDESTKRYNNAINTAQFALGYGGIPVQGQRNK